jgi:hypothetical protein
MPAACIAAAHPAGRSVQEDHWGGGPLQSEGRIEYCGREQYHGESAEGRGHPDVEATPTNGVAVGEERDS